MAEHSVDPLSFRDLLSRVGELRHLMSQGKVTAVPDDFRRELDGLLGVVTHEQRLLRETSDELRYMQSLAVVRQGLAEGGFIDQLQYFLSLAPTHSTSSSSSSSSSSASVASCRSTRSASASSAASSSSESSWSSWSSASPTASPRPSAFFSGDEDASMPQLVASMPPLVAASADAPTPAAVTPVARAASPPVPMAEDDFHDAQATLETFLRGNAAPRVSEAERPAAPEMSQVRQLGHVQRLLHDATFRNALEASLTGQLAPDPAPARPVRPVRPPRTHAMGNMHAPPPPPPPPAAGAWTVPQTNGAWAPLATDDDGDDVAAPLPAYYDTLAEDRINENYWMGQTTPVSNVLHSDFRQHLEHVIAEQLRAIQQQNIPRPVARSIAEAPPVPPPRASMHQQAEVQPRAYARTYTPQHAPQHPRVRQLERQVESMRGELSAMRQMLDRSLEMQVELQRSIHQELAGALNGHHVRQVQAPKPVAAGLCVVCCDASIDSVLLSCGHMCACNGCSQQMSDCPMCRAPIARIQRVYAVDAETYS